MQFTLHFRHDIMSMLKAVPNPRKTAMAGKTPVHSGVIFYPKDRIAVHAAVRSFSFHHKEVIHEERKKRQIPPLQVSHLPVPPAERRNQF